MWPFYSINAQAAKSCSLAMHWRDSCLMRRRWFSMIRSERRQPVSLRRRWDLVARKGKINFIKNGQGILNFPLRISLKRKPPEIYQWGRKEQTPPPPVLHILLGVGIAMLCLGLSPSLYSLLLTITPNNRVNEWVINLDLSFPGYSFLKTQLVS